MRRYFSFILLIILLASLAGCSQKVQNSEAMKASADELDQKFLTDYNNRDTDGLTSLFWNNPEVVRIRTRSTGNRIIKGWDSVKASYQKVFSDSRDFKMEIPELYNQVVADVVIGYGIWRWIVNIPDRDSTIVVDGRYSNVKAVRDGKWVYVLIHSSIPYSPTKVR
ncbi:MAG: nuclear transport factor 2 family protein [Ignavibacteriaceae bacterium]|jgi:hypothetical protein